MTERKNYEQPPLTTAIFKKAFNMSLDINEDISDNNFKWTSLVNSPSYLVGREALSLWNSDDYVVRFPIKYGFFNNDYQPQAVLDDLYKIIDFCITQTLQIKKKDLSSYNVVLILPDLIIKPQVKLLINLFLKSFGLKNIILHLESVMTTFGGAMQSACIVDVGGSKISICCVDDGMILEETMIRKNYGGDEQTKFLYMMLGRKNAKCFFPIDYFNINNSYHFRIFEKLKETECEFPSIINPSSHFPPKNCKLWLHTRGRSTKIFNATLAESPYITPLTYFYPEIFESFRNITIPLLNFHNDIYEEVYIDPEDTMDDLIKSLILSEKKDDGGLNNLNSSIKKPKLDNENDDSISVSQSRSDENNSQTCEDIAKSNK